MTPNPAESVPMAVGALAANAKAAADAVATLDTGTKNLVLRELAAELRTPAVRERILAANEADLRTAAGLDEAKRARLTLSERGLDQLCRGLLEVAELPDPVGQVVTDRVVERSIQGSGEGPGGEQSPGPLRVQQVRVPLGVICMIYEARPGVTIDAFALCFKAGNACILKGGREAAASNRALADVVHGVLARHGLPAHALTAWTSSDREELIELLRQRESIDLVIPRGGESLIRFVAEHSRIPTVLHYKGVNHIFIHRSAKPEMAIALAVSAKTSAPATCNAAECLLVDAPLQATLLPKLLDALRVAGVTVRTDDEAFGVEFLSKTIALRTVDGLDEAVSHILRFGSHHSEAIIAEDAAVAEAFLARVHASCTLWNASTRMNDGGALGIGAEIGISTSRIHAYGPMGLEELTSKRYVVRGQGHCR